MASGEVVPPSCHLFPSLHGIGQCATRPLNRGLLRLRGGILIAITNPFAVTLAAGELHSHRLKTGSPLTAGPGGEPLGLADGCRLMTPESLSYDTVFAQCSTHVRQSRDFMARACSAVLYGRCEHFRACRCPWSGTGVGSGAQVRLAVQAYRPQAFVASARAERRPSSPAEFTGLTR